MLKKILTISGGDFFLQLTNPQSIHRDIQKISIPVEKPPFNTGFMKPYSLLLSLSDFQARHR